MTLVCRGWSNYIDPAQKGDWERFINEGGAPKINESIGDGVARPVWGTETMQEIILAMPRKTVQSRVVYVSTQVAILLRSLPQTAQEPTQAHGLLPTICNAYLGGAAQEFGGPQATRVLGVPVLEVPYFPPNRVELTFPQNRIWGIQRDITVNREYIAKKDTPLNMSVFMRFGVAWEELDAVAYTQLDDAGDVVLP